MNGYGRLRDIRGGLQPKGQVSTSHDDDYVSLRDEVSRDLDRELSGRHFHTLTDSRLFCGGGEKLLWLGCDVAAVTSVKVGATTDNPSVFGDALVQGIDWAFWPRNAALEQKPYRAIERISGTWATGRNNVQIAGRFGWFEHWEAAGVTGTVADTTTLTITCANSGQVEVGDMVQLGSEVMGDVTRVSASEFDVAVRGANGTTADDHSGVAVYVRRYPLDIEKGVRERVISLRWDQQFGSNAGPVVEEMKNTSSIRGAWPRWQKLVRDYGDPSGYF